MPTARVDPPACAVCGAPSPRRLGTLNGLPLVRCDRCGHDALVTAGADLTALYGDHYAGFRDDAFFARRIREVVETTFVPGLPRGARVLDVGCGNGEFLVAARERGFEARGLDFSDAARDACARRGVPAERGDFLTHAFDRPFEAITLWDVIEHLDHPHAFAVRARALLAPGGLFVLKVPCYPRGAVDLARRVPRVAGALLSAPAHVQFFRPDTVARLLRRAGFDDVRVEPIAPMRSATRTGSPWKRVKRGVILGLMRLTDVRSVLVVARAPSRG